MKGRGRGKAPGGKGATTGGAESKKRDEGSREKKTGGETEEASGGRETTERESKETDKGSGGTAETKRGRRCLPLGSRSTGGGRTGAEKKLVKEDESGTIGVSSVQGGDESDRPPPSDKKTTGPLSSQGDFGTTLSEGRNGEGARN